MNNAFRFDEGTNGICSWEDYPYVGHKHWLQGCQEQMCTKVKGSEVASFVNVTNTDEGLMEALAIQPVSVAIDAGGVSERFSRIHLKFASMSLVSSNRTCFDLFIVKFDSLLLFWSCSSDSNFTRAAFLMQLAQQTSIMEF